jgi:hypothetical protein
MYTAESKAGAWRASIPDFFPSTPRQEPPTLVPEIRAATLLGVPPILLS